MIRTRTIALSAIALLLVVLAIGTSTASVSAQPYTWPSPLTGTFTATTSGAAMPARLWHAWHATPLSNLTVQLSISGSWKGYVNATSNRAVVRLNVTGGSLTLNGTSYQILRGTGEYFKGERESVTFSYLSLQLSFTNSTTTTTTPNNLPHHLYRVNVMLFGGVNNGNVNLTGELMFPNPPAPNNYKGRMRIYNYRLLLQGTEAGLP